MVCNACMCVCRYSNLSDVTRAADLRLTPPYTGSHHTPCMCAAMTNMDAMMQNALRISLCDCVTRVCCLKTQMQSTHRESH